MSSKTSYIRECGCEDLAPSSYAVQQGPRPELVREALRKLSGSKEGDLLAALVWQHDRDRQRYASLLARYLELRAQLPGPGVGSAEFGEATGSPSPTRRPTSKRP